MQSIGLKKKISLAHSKDADDAFMFYALFSDIIQNQNFEIKNVLKDIQTLNTDSLSEKFDIQAVSFFMYPEIEDKYQLLSCGGSLGNGYGPLLVGKKKFSPEDLKKETILVPGEKTTAFLLLKLLLKDFKYKVLPFDEILESVAKGNYSLGLLIHEGQLAYVKYGLVKILDLGEWWHGKTNLPVPLGGNVIKRAFANDEKKEINSLIKKSIVYGLENVDKIIPYVAKYARGISDDTEKVKEFVTMYVNEFTVDYGVQGKLAIKKLYELALKDGLINKMPVLDFVVS